jgi:hypothetical protein
MEKKLRSQELQEFRMQIPVAGTDIGLESKLLAHV